MNAKPVKRGWQPAYPARLDVLERPELLKRNQPVLWKRSAEMAGAFGLFLAANLAGCSNPMCDVSASARDPFAPETPAVSPAQPQPPADMPPSAEPASQPAAPAIMAPIFQHGDGRGATGCIVSNPPVFFSEEEALQIITEELGKEGLNFSEKRVPLEGVTIARVPGDAIREGEAASAGPEQTPKPFQVDLRDPARHVAVEYVSVRDEDEARGGVAFGQGYNMQKSAENLARQLGEQASGVYFGTFYDPMIAVDGGLRRYTGPDMEPAEVYVERKHREARAEAQRLLRQQVKDFADWLKAQGAI